VDENQQKLQRDQSSRTKCSVAKKKANNEFASYLWAFTMSLSFGMLLSVFVIAGIKYLFGMPINVPWHSEL
uniref:Vesicle transport protein n=1 Tax=Mesocestoides corti TaxID=53468 RepID=A0A5K3FSS4_MESCO